MAQSTVGWFWHVIESSRVGVTRRNRDRAHRRIIACSPRVTVSMTRSTDTTAPRPAAATLVIDIGGTGRKASVLDKAGVMLTDRVRTPTTYPCPPDELVAQLAQLVEPLPAFPNAELVAVSRGGHRLHRTHPELITGVVHRVIADAAR